MRDLRRLDKTLIQLNIDFNTQLQALGSDTKEFHKSLIKLTAKYPEHEELLDFIVYINDNLERNQTMFKDIVVESFNELIKSKKELIEKMIEDKNEIDNEAKKPTGFLAKTKDIGSLVKNTKVIIIGVAVIVLAIGAIVAPQLVTEILKEIPKLL